MLKISAVLSVSFCFMVAYSDAQHPQCQDDFAKFNRTTHLWCLRVFKGTFTQDEAQHKCGEFGAVLSGFMNSDEEEFVNLNAVGVIGRPTGSIRIGLKRTPACLKEVLTATCTRENSFYYTDGKTTGTEGLVWDLSQNQPDNAWDRSQACAVYFAAKTGGISMKHGNWNWLTRRLDDVQCGLKLNYGGPRKIVGYLCGKSPV